MLKYIFGIREFVYITLCTYIFENLYYFTFYIHVISIVYKYMLLYCITILEYKINMKIKFEKHLLEACSGRGPLQLRRACSVCTARTLQEGGTSDSVYAATN